MLTLVHSETGPSVAIARMTSGDVDDRPRVDAACGVCGPFVSIAAPDRAALPGAQALADQLLAAHVATKHHGQVTS